MNRVVLVMPYEQYVRQAQEAGFWVCSVWDPKYATPDYLRQVEARSDAFLITDFQDYAGYQRVLRHAAQHHDARWIYHIGREDSMLPAYEIAEELGISPNPASAIRLLNDKLAMRQCLDAAGLSPVRYTCVEEAADVADVASHLGFPVVVKPTSLSGSRGVYLLRSPADRDVWGHLVNNYCYPGPFLVEEQLRGPEFSVESLSLDGRHLIVGITGKQVSPPPLFVERGHVYPAPLPGAIRREIEDLVTQFLNICGYRFGPAHTEVILTADGPRIVESQARLGGDRIHRLVELSTGLDLEAAVFKLLAGGPLPKISHRRTAQIRYLSLAPGRVRSVDGLEQAASASGVEELDFPFRISDLVPETTDSKTRHGHVVVTGDSPADTEIKLTAAMATLRIETSQTLEPVPGGTTS